MLQQDDLDPGEAIFRSQHLRECAACRQRLADAEWVGEALRDLPQFAPPPSFSAAVHARIAAIAQEEADRSARRGASGVAIAALSRADTLPELPIIRTIGSGGSGARTASAPMVRLPVAHAQSSRFGPVARAAMGLAAVFLIAVFLAQFTRGLASFGSIASGFFNGVPQGGSQTHITSYIPNARFHTVTDALASTGWLVYSAVDAAGAAMLVVENRLTKQGGPLLPTALAAPITLYALTSRWVIWGTGRGASTGSVAATGQWALYATLLPSTNAATLTSAALANLTYTLADDQRNGPDDPTAFDGVWADDTMALVAEETQAGESALLRFPLSGAPAASATHQLTGISAYQAAAGHRVMRPSADGGVMYWADVWAGADHALHSAIWREGATGQAQRALPSDDDAFYPTAAHGTLVWVSAAAPITGAARQNTVALENPLTASPLALLDAVAATATVGAGDDSLAAVTGAVQAYSVSDQRQWVIGEDASADSLQASGNLLLWRSGARTHTYDLRAKAPTSVDSQVAAAPVADVTATSIVWSAGPASPIEVYDAAA